MGFSSEGLHRGRDSADGPQIWDPHQAAAVQRVEDSQRSDLLWALADSLQQPAGRVCYFVASYRHWGCLLQGVPELSLPKGGQGFLPHRLS